MVRKNRKNRKKQSLLRLRNSDVSKERSNLKNSKRQTKILFWTLVFAIIVGVAQSCFLMLQTQINERELKLNYQMSLLTGFNMNTSDIEFVNKGRSNIIIKSVQFKDEQVQGFKETVIPPNGELYLTSDLAIKYFRIGIQELANKYITTQIKESANWEIPLIIVAESSDEMLYRIENTFTIRYDFPILESEELNSLKEFYFEHEKIRVIVQPSTVSLVRDK